MYIDKNHDLYFKFVDIYSIFWNKTGCPKLHLIKYIYSSGHCLFGNKF